MTRVFDFTPSADNAKTMAQAVVNWWDEARFETSGSHGERNVFDETPVFVEMAQKLLGQPSGLTYLDACRTKVRELSTLVADFTSIAENESVDAQHRFHLVMAPECKGRILELFASLGMPASLDYYDPGILGYDSCVSLTKSEFEVQMRSLQYLLEKPEAS